MTNDSYVMDEHEAAYLAAQEALDDADRAEWADLPLADPDMPGLWNDGLYGPHLTAAQVLAEARASDAALGREHRGVKLRADGGLWPDPLCGWYRPAT